MNASGKAFGVAALGGSVSDDFVWVPHSVVRYAGRRNYFSALPMPTEWVCLGAFLSSDEEYEE